jgi:hypothetical protein
MRADVKHYITASRASPDRKTNDYSKQAEENVGQVGMILVVRDSQIDESAAPTTAERATPTAGLDRNSWPQIGRKRRRKVLKRLDSGMELAPGATLRTPETPLRRNSQAGVQSTVFFVRGPLPQAKGLEGCSLAADGGAVVAFVGLRAGFRDARFAGFSRPEGARAEREPASYGVTGFGA